MLNTQVFILEISHFAPRSFQYLAQTRRYTWLTGAIDARHAFDFAFDETFCRCITASHFLNDLLEHSTILGE